MGKNHTIRKAPGGTGDGKEASFHGRKPWGDGNTHRPLSAVKVLRCTQQARDVPSKHQLPLTGPTVKAVERERNIPLSTDRD